MHHAAVSAKESNIAELEIGEINVETKVQTLSGHARISIKNLLNPSTPSPTKSSDTPLVVDWPVWDIITLNLDGSPTLNHKLMTSLRHKHDTANSKIHSGNEKRKKLAPQALDGTSLATSTGQPKASQCSKLVALIIKESITNQTSLSRMHRWNINVKIDFPEVRNTSTNFGVNIALLSTRGAISQENELTYGKFAVVIKDHVSRKSFYIHNILKLTFCPSFRSFT